MTAQLIEPSPISSLAPAARRVIDCAARQVINTCEGTLTFRDIAAAIEIERASQTLSYKHRVDARQARIVLEDGDLVRLRWLMAALCVSDGLSHVTVVVSDQNSFSQLQQLAQMTDDFAEFEVLLSPQNGVAAPLSDADEPVNYLWVLPTAGGAR